ncbi:MAG: hypothetical protein IPL35_12650 [Sphingobacteriales bacterium]|nr:hypothetical protein [Sphingobacteriales bacterium]
MASCKGHQFILFGEKSAQIIFEVPSLLPRAESNVFRRNLPLPPKSFTPYKSVNLRSSFSTTAPVFPLRAANLARGCLLADNLLCVSMAAFDENQNFDVRC